MDIGGENGIDGGRQKTKVRVRASTSARNMLITLAIEYKSERNQHAHHPTNQR